MQLSQADKHLPLAKVSPKYFSSKTWRHSSLSSQKDFICRKIRGFSISSVHVQGSSYHEGAAMWVSFGEHQQDNAGDVAPSAAQAEMLISLQVGFPSYIVTFRSKQITKRRNAPSQCRCAA